jgi:putative transposase
VTRPSISLPIALHKGLEQASSDLLRELLRMFLEKLMSAEVDTLCGADCGERTEECLNSCNVYRIRPLETRVGEMAGPADLDSQRTSPVRDRVDRYA